MTQAGFSFGLWCCTEKAGGIFSSLTADPLLGFSPAEPILRIFLALFSGVERLPSLPKFTSRQVGRGKKHSVEDSMTLSAST